MPDLDNKQVDLDVTGPAMDVDIAEEQDQAEVEQTEVKEEPSIRPVVEETSNEIEVKEETTEETKEAPKTDEKELEQYSESVQRRIAKLTHKWREAERQKDEAAEFARGQYRLREAAENKISKLEPSFLKSTEDSITSGVQAAQAKLAAAREANDLTAEAEALTAISELGYKKAKLEETRNAQEEFNANKAKQVRQVRQPELNLNRQQAAQGTPDPKAETWASRNSWFGQDNAMTYTAFDLHKKLTEEEGYDPQSDEYYS